MRRNCLRVTLPALVCVLVWTLTAEAQIADSVADWSATGTQGENGWFNGYYNLTTDDDGVYGADDFVAFTNEEGPIAPDGNHWNGTGWDLLDEAAGPWTELYAEGTHPNGANSDPNEEHWTIRRWVSTVSQPVDVTWHVHKQNVGCGNGVTGMLLVNGELLDSEVVAFDDGEGVTRSVAVELAEGDTVDLALSPVGSDGDGADGCDGSVTSLTIAELAEPEPQPVPEPEPEPAIADSIADWSASGTQGENGWFNGYYNLTTDDDGVYGIDDFSAFTNQEGPVEPGGNHWTGSAFDLTPEAVGPWTFLAQEGTHPNGANSDPNEEHWTIRRWVSTASQPVELSWSMRKENVGCGNGVTGMLFVNGELVDSATIAFDDAAGVTRAVETELGEGDIVDLALSPLGTDEDGGDACDGSLNSLTITASEGPPPLTVFRRGDADGSGALEIPDATLSLEYLFLGGVDPLCLDAFDADDSGGIDVTDAVFGLEHLFQGGPEPPPPGPASCGEDPTEDGLDCAAYPTETCG